jgi:putative addiction module component (TIGR02574 family)
MALNLEQFGIDKLPANDRLELAELLWDSVELDPAAIPDWHVQVLKERLKPSKESGIPWETVKKRLLGEDS